MPYENIIAPVLIMLVLLVPLLKWAKDKWMTDPIRVDDLEIPFSACQTPEALVDYLTSHGRNFIDFFESFKDILSYELGEVGQSDYFAAIDRFYCKAKAKELEVASSIYALLGNTSITLEICKPLLAAAKSVLGGALLEKAIGLLEDRMKLFKKPQTR